MTYTEIDLILLVNDEWVKRKTFHDEHWVHPDTFQPYTITAREWIEKDLNYLRKFSKNLKGYRLITREVEVSVTKKLISEETYDI